MDNQQDEVRGIAALAEPARRALYDFVVGRRTAVGRDEAAEAVGISRATAAFHLDRLVALGLLDTESRRLSGRQGPGAGRPAKLYRRARREFAVTVPPRRYDLAAELLAEAVQRAAQSGTDVAERLAEVARERGRALAAAARGRLRPRAGRQALLRAVAQELAGRGYEPGVEGGEVVLRNCPFGALADTHRSLVCGMNLDLLQGLAQELDGERLAARLAPAEGCCCVRLAAGTERAGSEKP